MDITDKQKIKDIQHVKNIYIKIFDPYILHRNK